MYNFFNKIFDRLLKLPRFIVFVLLALSFIYGSTFGSIWMASYAASLLSMNINLYVGIILFGLVYWLLFELLTAGYFWIIKSMMGVTEIYKNKTNMINILRWIFIVRNIISGSLRLIYFKYPLAVPLTENIVIFTLELAALILYYFYIRKKYIAPQLYPRSVMAFCAPYLFYLLFTLMLNFSGALLG